MTLFEIRTTNAQWPDLNLLWSGRSERKAKAMLARKTEFCRERGYDKLVLFYGHTIIETEQQP